MLDVAGFARSGPGSNVRVGNFELRGTSDGIDLARYHVLQSLLVEGAFQVQDDGAADPTLVDDLLSLYDAIATTEGSLAARDVLLVWDDEAPYTIERAELSVSAVGLDGDLAQMTVEVGLSGASLPTDGAPEVPEGLSPESLDLSLAIENLPWPALWRTLMVAGHSMEPTDDLVLSFLAAAQEAGTRLRLLPSLVHADRMEVTGEGELRGDAAAVMGVVASFLFEISGLADAMAAEPGFWDDLGAMGEVAEGADGERIHRYEIVFDADGMLTVNGEPMPLFGPDMQ